MLRAVVKHLVQSLLVVTAADPGVVPPELLKGDRKHEMTHNWADSAVLTELQRRRQSKKEEAV
jgi:hypothetical protein